MTGLIALFLTIGMSFAQDRVGGGGDGSEIRVNEIRADILNWIFSGGPKGLIFEQGATLEEYNTKMSQILHPKTVVIVFVEKDSETDVELQVSVDANPKTCRGFISIKTGFPTILCSIPRFEKTTATTQYKLIHHEYAGLVALEKNDGAASDYYLSQQLTEFLTPTTVLRLGIKKPVKLEHCSLKFPNNSTADMRKILNTKFSLTDKEDFEYSLEGKSNCRYTSENGSDSLGNDNCDAVVFLYNHDHEKIATGEGHAVGPFGNPSERAMKKALKDLPNCRKGEL